MSLNEKRIDKMIKTTDDWHPCFNGNKIKVSIFIQYNTNLNYHFVRMCAWGNDDFGLELDYHSSCYESLLYVYTLWKENIFDKIPNIVNKQWFYEHGFYPA